jgi:hypothetical protein
MTSDRRCRRPDGSRIPRRRAAGVDISHRRGVHDQHVGPVRCEGFAPLRLGHRDRRAGSDAGRRRRGRPGAAHPGPIAPPTAGRHPSGTA